MERAVSSDLTLVLVAHLRLVCELVMNCPECKGEQMHKTCNRLEKSHTSRLHARLILFSDNLQSQIDAEHLTHRLIVTIMHSFRRSQRLECLESPAKS